MFPQNSDLPRFSIFRASGGMRRVQMLCDICIYFARYLYSTKQCWIIKQRESSLGRTWTMVTLQSKWLSHCVCSSRNTNVNLRSGILLFWANGKEEKECLIHLLYELSAVPLLLNCQLQCYLMLSYKCDPIRFYQKFMQLVGSIKVTKCHVHIYCTGGINSKLKCLLILLETKKGN